MDRCIDNGEETPEKQRKSHEMSECCVVMGLGSSNCKEQQLLEAAAFQLILLSNNNLPQKPCDCKGYDSDGCTGNSGCLGGITRKKKKKRQDYGEEGAVKLHENDRDAKSVTSSSSSAETVKSGMSSVSMDRNEVKDNTRTADQRVLPQRRLRSIIDIYHVTTRL